jgi:hypothetical protein
MKKLLIISLLLIGCTAKKETVTRDIQKDSLVTKSYQYVSQPISTTITIDDICDSITGKPRKFAQVESSGLNKANISITDNKLNIDLLTGLSESKGDTIYVYRYKDRVKTEEVVRYKTSWTHWLAHFISILILLILLKFRF